MSAFSPTRRDPERAGTAHRPGRRLALVAGAAVSLAAGSVLAAPSAFASGTLANGLTAKVVAHSGQIIRGVIDATGYDVGVYIGPGVHGVKVLGATITNAHDHGILVQDAHDDLVEGSTVANNGLIGRHTTLEEDKAIALAGTVDVVVAGNTVVGNGDGGIGVYDDGPHSENTVALTNLHSTGVAGVGNVVWGNRVKDNLRGCGIVVAAKNPGGGLRNNVVAFNTVNGFDPAGGDTTPGAVGGIVVAGGTYGATEVTHTVVAHNQVTGGYIPGISLHDSAPGVQTGTQVLANVLTRNGSGAGGQPTGIELATAGGTIDGTRVLCDRVLGDYFGVFHVGDTDTRIEDLSAPGATAPVAP